MTKMFSVGDYKYQVAEVKLEDLPPNGDLEGPEPSRELLSSVASVGIVYPIIVLRWEDELHVIDGRRRIKAARACNMDTIVANIFTDIREDDQAAWAIILNEQRSVNPVTEYQYYKALMAKANWEEVISQYQINKAHMDRIMSLDNLASIDFISSYEDGKIAESTLFEIAKLGEPRQKYLLGILDTKGKLTAKDVKQARTARTNAVLEASSEHFKDMNMREQVSKAPAMLYATLSTTDIEHADVQLFADFHQAWQYKLEHGNGTKMYQLIEV